MNGLLVIDKPGGMTSRDAVNRVQRWFPRRMKIGHTGTLDPLATGVLVVCIGTATRLADYVQAMGKTYASRFRLGTTSTTDDADGVVTETPSAVPPTREQIDAVLASFIGSIEQVPPAFSALKVSGERAHDLARRGKDVPLAARPVRIDTIRVLGYAWPFLNVEIYCGKGTYIRSIARDLGAKLACGGLVQTLRRTRVGPFTAEQGIGLDVDPAGVKLLPMTSAVAGMPQLRLSADDVRRLQQGQRVKLTSASGGRQPPAATVIALLDEVGELVGIGLIERGQIKPQIVFPS
jgi:tRNA pseudouridine55 synthase